MSPEIENLLVIWAAICGAWSIVLLTVSLVLWRRTKLLSANAGPLLLACRVTPEMALT
jgi:hypothetical protein